MQPLMLPHGPPSEVLVETSEEGIQLRLVEAPVLVDPPVHDGVDHPCEVREGLVTAPVRADCGRAVGWSPLRNPGWEHPETHTGGPLPARRQRRSGAPPKSHHSGGRSWKRGALHESARAGDGLSEGPPLGSGDRPEALPGGPSAIPDGSEPTSWPGGPSGPGPSLYG